MKCDADFKKDILDRCLAALSNVGFRRYKKDNVDYPINVDFNGWVGLNTGLYDDRLEINPFVGVHAIAVEKMWFGLSGKKDPGPYGRVATFAIHLGEVDCAKNEKAFVFSLGQSDELITSEVLRLANIYSTCGMQFARSISSYEAILPLIRSRVSMLGGYPQRLCCCLYLMGLKEEARQFADDFRKEEPENFESFARSFMEVCNLNG